MAELLLQFQGIDVGKAQLRRGLPGRPLHDGLERGELRGHAGRGQEHVVFGAVVEPGKLLPQGLAHGLVIGPRRTPGQHGFGLAGGNNQPRMLPERAQGGGAGFAGHDAMNAAERHHLRLRVAAALDELGATPGGAERGEGQARLSVADLPRQFPHLRMNEEARITAGRAR